MTSQTFTVTGMTCGHCAASVTEEISEIEGVENVDVVVETVRAPGGAGGRCSVGDAGP